MAKDDKAFTTRIPADQLQPPPIKGYRSLDQDEIALINEVKEVSESVGNLVERLRLINRLDQRWVAIGQTDLQKGFMALARAIAQPTTF